ncbi:methylaspartate mutase accessory protein GlmL [Tissierella sp. Yu-01]|uniref:methylaspartate mutase accessory protein GlmL n=1 Tax=Tissierella sp. Yu-01 TaxID=3035694 RepID=UPI00240E0941|nr:methylaspartate mutase accessory protein GlmL [Tissierella sp. Yu-01]WFA09462.1 methylaspartate mutase accessory protein GlmL [Tissierella sp. Yu-01]
MDAYLFIDFGSTFTKLTLVDIEKEEIIATEKSYTTVETDVTIGYENALKKLKEKVSVDYNIVKKLACSSAAGGLKIIAIGLVPELTAEAAKRAALGAGAKVIKTFSFKLNNSELEEIKNSNADMILLAGGTDGGNCDTIIHNATMIEKFNISIPVVIAGNKSSNDEVKEIFGEKIEYYVTENVMPNLNHINVDPARETIRSIFMKKIVHAKGMENVEESISGILMPTPASVLKAAEALSKGSRDEDGIGDLAIIDIGGATTDIHSIAEGAPSKPGVILRGLEEPHSKRTVEGDLGMRYSALSVFEAAGTRTMKKYLKYKDIDIEGEFKNRYTNTSYVADSEQDIDFDEAMAKVCADISMKRHAGVVETIYSPMGMMYSQEGKDLMELPYVLGTGGVIVNSLNPREILEASLFTMEDPTSLKPRRPKFLLDKEYILSAMGLLTTIDPNMAVRMLKKYIVEI